MWSVSAAFWIDAATFLVSILAILAMAPMPALDGGTRPGLRSILDGLRFLRDKKAIQGAFLIDINATVFGVPRALFPEMGLSVLGGSEATVGLLFAAPGFGALIGAATSGWVGRVHRAGRATTIAVFVWGIAIASFGFSSNLMFGLIFLGIAGFADAISSVFRATIVQLTTPDHLRGRLSGLKIAAVGGGTAAGRCQGRDRLARIWTVCGRLVWWSRLCGWGDRHRQIVSQFLQLGAPRRGGVGGWMSLWMDRRSERVIVRRSEP